MLDISQARECIIQSNFRAFVVAWSLMVRGFFFHDISQFIYYLFSLLFSCVYSKWATGRRVKFKDEAGLGHCIL